MIDAEDRAGAPAWMGHPGQAKDELFDYIDVFYNLRRIQRRLGYRSPDEYEQGSRNGQLSEQRRPRRWPDGAPRV